MKVLLDMNDSRSKFFMEMIKSLNYVTVLEEIREKKKSELMAICGSFSKCFSFRKGRQEVKKGQRPAQ